MPAVDRGIEIGEIIVGADSFWLDQKATKGSLPEYIILKKCREGWSETSFPALCLYDKCAFSVLSILQTSTSQFSNKNGSSHFI
jgi:hypothetical protein